MLFSVSKVKLSLCAYLYTNTDILVSEKVGGDSENVKSVKVMYILIKLLNL